MVSKPSLYPRRQPSLVRVGPRGPLRLLDEGA
jgi:hypothetical protein